MPLCSRCDVDLKELEGYISVAEHMWRTCDVIEGRVSVVEESAHFCSYSCLLEWYK